jgi:hypothetical protein
MLAAFEHAPVLDGKDDENEDPAEHKNGVDAQREALLHEVEREERDLPGLDGMIGREEEIEDVPGAEPVPIARTGVQENQFDQTEIGPASCRSAPRPRRHRQMHPPDLCGYIEEISAYVKACRNPKMIEIVQTSGEMLPRSCSNCPY